jgi:peptide-methionine (S)-S-oxide reductase
LTRRFSGAGTGSLFFRIGAAICIPSHRLYVLPPVKHRLLLLLTAGLAAFSPSCTAAESKVNSTPITPATQPAPGLERAIFGGGCFWCVEAVFERIPGVKDAVSGYAGGHKPNPTYEEICSHTTGHAEVVLIDFDPKVVSYAKLLEVFWKSHDPTTLNRQGHDVGDNYRSIILTLTEEQEGIAEQFKTGEQKNWPNPIVTQIEPLKIFYTAEVSHQDYYRLNGNKNPYCQAVIRPKMEKLESKGILQKK